MPLRLRLCGNKAPGNDHERATGTGPITPLQGRKRSRRLFCSGVFCPGPLVTPDSLADCGDDAVVIFVSVRFRYLQILFTFDLADGSTLDQSPGLRLAEHPHVFHINMADVYRPITALRKV